MLKAGLVNRKIFAFYPIKSCWESFDFVKDEMCLHFDRTLPTFESVNPTVRVQKVMLLHYCKKNDLILTLDICPNGIYFIALTPKPDSFRTASWAAQNTAGTGSTHLFLRSTLDDSQGHLSF